MLRRKHRRRKRKAARRFKDRPIKYMVETALCVAFVCATFYSFMQFVEDEPGLHLKTMTVEGARMLDGETVLAQAGVTTEDSIFSSPRAIRRQLKENPVISACEVQRIFPDKLVVRIKERVSTATLVFNNRKFLLDNEGNVLRELQPGEEHTGPLITEVLGIDDVQVGRRLTQPALQAALEVWLAFNKTGVARYMTVSEICADQLENIRMYCDEITAEIRWCRGKIGAQAWKLDVVWNARKGHMNAREYVDLRFGQDVACL